ncbi:MAG TPA: glutamine--tRNA ligase/YqeY domain fusion protein [Pirellulales bacterium]|jgi:glutaminyl-tRNA synthetase|nr:glutamine--tRNA ligase/YqeY domain fusion protein [Pirellulales bacterium]
MPDEPRSLNFIEEIIEEHARTGRFGNRVQTRFPPEPNGYLHIGHAKSICLNFGLAIKYHGTCNLRFDDTNPTKEEEEYVESIEEDVRWLGFHVPPPLYASDYFEQIHAWAVQLIQAGYAYVCDLNADQIREYRGTLTTPGKNSPFRTRPVEENLDLFARMGKGEFPEGSRTLRAKVDMAHPNLNMRDPVMYRILYAKHHRTGDRWCIYPMYDWAHGQSDSIENVTHSICTLEFENHRPLYDWYLDRIIECNSNHAAAHVATHVATHVAASLRDASASLGETRQGVEAIIHPQQIEFARLNLTYTMMSKRRLLELVKDKHVAGWDDPRMPTICGLRRRGYTPESIRLFCDRIGVAKFNSTIDMAVLEGAVREDLNRRAPRRMGVLRPLKVVIDNYPADKIEMLEAVNNPEDPAAGKRQVPFSRTLYIEQDDFREEPPKKFFRLAPGAEVRLRYAYIIKCVSVTKDSSGAVTEVHCTYDPETKSGLPQSDRKVKGTIHWVSAAQAVTAPVRLYDHLFSQADPDDVPAGQNYLVNLNPNSLETLTEAKLEPSLVDAQPGNSFQFERTGYFIADRIDSQPGQPVFNRTVTLKDTWAKIEQKGGR